jgi:hypothetical protein
MPLSQTFLGVIQKGGAAWKKGGVYLPPSVIQARFFGRALCQRALYQKQMEFQTITAGKIFRWFSLYHLYLLQINPDIPLAIANN